tara:strand:+ start:169 stop:486 length:318 start_codon:yes stop_codon:yes gene_type:complete
MSFFTGLFLTQEFWIILGILLIILDISVGFQFFVLSIGFSSFIIAFLLYAQEKLWSSDFNISYIILSDWQDVLITLSILSILTVGIIKYVFQNRFGKSKKDINDY